MEYVLLLLERVCLILSSLAFRDFPCRVIEVIIFLGHEARTLNNRASMPLAGFEPSVVGSERQHTDDLDRMATRSCFVEMYLSVYTEHRTVISCLKSDLKCLEIVLTFKSAVFCS